RDFASGGELYDSVFSNCSKVTPTQIVGHIGTIPVTIRSGSPTLIILKNQFLGGEQVVFETTGALPTGLTTSNSYYVIRNEELTSEHFEISATTGGPPINTTSTGTGTHGIATLTVVSVRSGALPPNNLPAAGYQNVSVNGIGTEAVLSGLV